MRKPGDTWAISECIDYGEDEAPAYDPPIGATAREQLRTLEADNVRLRDVLRRVADDARTAGELYIAETARSAADA